MGARTIRNAATLALAVAVATTIPDAGIAASTSASSGAAREIP